MRHEFMPKYRRIVLDLHRKVQAGVLKPGDAVPSYREMMGEYGVTVTVVRQAMQVVQAEGLVESIPRVGCRIAQPAQEWHTIGIAIFGYADSPFHTDQIKQLHDELDRLQCDVAVRFVDKPDDASLETCCAWVQRLDGVLMTGRVPLRVATRVLATGVPVVQVGELVDAEGPAGLSLVSVDVASMVHLAVSHLVTNGHRRVALDCATGSRYYSSLRDAFRTRMQEHGLAGQWTDLIMSDGCRPTPSDVLRLVEAMTEPPTAILVEEGEHASRVVETLNANNWPVPKRISVLAISASSQPPHVMEGLSCILSSTRELDLRAVQIVNDALRSPVPVVRVERLSAVFVRGSTCGPAADGTTH